MILLIAPVGIGISLVVLWAIGYGFYLQQYGVFADAVVTSVRDASIFTPEPRGDETRTRDAGTTTYRQSVTYAYAVRGHEYTGTALVTLGRSDLSPYPWHVVGGRFPIIFVPSRPDRSYPSSTGVGGLPALPVLAMLFVIGMMVWLLIALPWTF